MSTADDGRPAHAPQCPTHEGRKLCTCKYPDFTTFNDGVFCVIVRRNYAYIGKQDDAMIRIARFELPFEEVCNATDRATIERLYDGMCAGLIEPWPPRHPSPSPETHP